MSYFQARVDGKPACTHKHKTPEAALKCTNKPAIPLNHPAFIKASYPDLGQRLRLVECTENEADGTEDVKKRQTFVSTLNYDVTTSGRWVEEQEFEARYGQNEGLPDYASLPTRYKRMGALIGSFPILKGAPTKWSNAEGLIKWLSKNAHIQARVQAGLFCLWVWNSECTHPTLGGFDFKKAMSCWDDAQRAAFHHYLSAPFGN